jgi:hypothetical protein
MLLNTDAFFKTATVLAKTLGFPDMERLVVPHPLSGNSEDLVRAKVHEVAPVFLAWLRRVT